MIFCSVSSTFIFMHAIRDYLTPGIVSLSLGFRAPYQAVFFRI
jgi:hypothetical protein